MFPLSRPGTGGHDSGSGGTGPWLRSPRLRVPRLRVRRSRVRRLHVVVLASIVVGITFVATPRRQTEDMAFGQQSGPPATARQVNELLELLNQAGHTDFRDARGPMGFTQRQANGKFTAGEATEFIEQLNDAIAAGDDTIAGAPVAPLSADERAARRLPDAVLASELQRRGWIVVEP